MYPNLYPICTPKFVCSIPGDRAGVMVSGNSAFRLRRPASTSRLCYPWLPLTDTNGC